MNFLNSIEEFDEKEQVKKVIMSKKAPNYLGKENLILN